MPLNTKKNPQIRGFFIVSNKIVTTITSRSVLGY
jgi:hypothetical protein